MPNKNESEFDDFNTAMDTILKVDPKAVKEQMEHEKQERAEQRKRNRKDERNK